MTAKYSKGMPKFRTTTTQVPPNELVVILTGSTGSLGSHMLAGLLQQPRVKKVITIDRGVNPLDSLRASFRDRGLPGDLLTSPKLICLTGDLSKPDLGLDAGNLSMVRFALLNLQAFPCSRRSTDLSRCHSHYTQCVEAGLQPVLELL